MASGKKFMEAFVRDDHQQFMQKWKLPLNPVGREHFVEVEQDLWCFAMLEATEVLTKKYIACQQRLVNWTAEKLSRTHVRPETTYLTTRARWMQILTRNIQGHHTKPEHDIQALANPIAHGAQELADVLSYQGFYQGDGGRAKNVGNALLAGPVLLPVTHCEEALAAKSAVGRGFGIGRIRAVDITHSSACGKGELGWADADHGTVSFVQCVQCPRAVARRVQLDKPQ